MTVVIRDENAMIAAKSFTSDSLDPFKNDLHFVKSQFWYNKKRLIIQP